MLFMLISCVNKQNDINIENPITEGQKIRKDTNRVENNKLSLDSLYMSLNDKQKIYKADSLLLTLRWVENNSENVCIYLKNDNNLTADTIREQDFSAMILVSQENIGHKLSDTIIINRDILFNSLLKTYDNPDSLVRTPEFDINRYYIGDFRIVKFNSDTIITELSMIIADTDVGEIYHYVHAKNKKDSVFVVGTTIPISE